MPLEEVLGNRRRASQRTIRIKNEVKRGFGMPLEKVLEKDAQRHDIYPCDAEFQIKRKPS
jgi:hypothetical protein